MNTSLLLFVVCVLGIQCFPSTRSKRLSEDEEDELVDKINAARKMSVQKWNITNMWKLEWSDELEEKMADLPKDCSSLTPGSDYRYSFLTDTDERTKWIDDEVANMNDNRDFKKYASKTLLAKEYHIPEQKEIACASYECKSYPSIFPGRASQSFNLICLLGPKGTLETDEDIFGDPGKTCEDEDGEEEDGLCVPSGSAVVYGIPILVLFVFLVTNVFAENSYL